MKFYDTRLRKLVNFVPHRDHVTIYVCGITPYDAAHLGHIFTFLAYDLLQRRLEDQGHSVRLVRNITDVDEPIFVKAAENNETYTELASREIAKFQDIMSHLNFREPKAEPLASEYISEMADAVQTLLKDGHAYRLDEDIYFDVTTYQNFGSLSGFSDRITYALMQDRGGDPERVGKRHPLDFLLWRGISDRLDLAAWESPMGYGRPGWHIECSVMSSHLLGTPIDIHGGGMDLIFPHHECELAQSESLGSKPFVRNWLHVAPLLWYGEKMSKSLGNLVFASDLITDASPPVVRLALLNYHYGVGGEWRDEFWQDAKHLYKDVQQLLSDGDTDKRTSLLTKTRELLDANLDTPAILVAIQNHVSNRGSSSDLRATLDLLGIATE